VWSVPDGKLVALFKHPTGVTSVAFSVDGRSVVSGSYDGAVRVWSVTDGKLARTMKASSSTVWAVAVSPDGRFIASSGEDSTVRVWRASDGALLRTLRGHSRNVWSIAFSPDSKTLASGSFDKTAKIWRMDDGTLRRTIDAHTQAVVHVAYSSTGILATGGDDNTVKLWTADGRLLRTITVGNHVYSIDFSPDGKWLVTGGRGRSALATFWHQLVGERTTFGDPQGLKLWRVSDGSLQQSITGHTDDVWSVTFSRDGRWLASSGEDETAKVWKLSTK
jgi:WD40 repeat protein